MEPFQPQPERPAATDTAIQRADELGVSLAEVQGTGYLDRITADDVRRYADSRGEATAGPATASDLTVEPGSKPLRVTRDGELVGLIVKGKRQAAAIRQRHDLPVAVLGAGGEAAALEEIRRAL